jgi:uncharacterized membrane protein YeaQ/YmgE (transglycosylase-associated protein family)
MRHILSVLLIGFFAGLLARVVYPGEHKMGIIMTTLLGIAGAFVATYVGHALHLYQPGDTAHFIGAAIGAFGLLLLGGVIHKML